MRIIFMIVVLAIIGTSGGLLWNYRTLMPCGILEQEMRKDFVIAFDESEEWTEEEKLAAEKRMDEAMHAAVSQYSQLQCADKVLAFWFQDDPYGDTEDSL